MTTPLQRIVLTGFMGSGKTTVGRLLAARLRWRFVDLDDAVEAATGRGVPEIFATSGEPAFRAAETAALTALLREENLVLALGGGAPGTAANREMLAAAQGTAVVHLQAPFALLYGRCLLQSADPAATERPLLGDRSSSEARYTARTAVYREVATHAVVAEGPSEAVAHAILRLLQPA